MPSPHYRSQASLRPTLGLVVPSWFPPAHDPDDAAAVLGTTLADLDTVFEPRHCRVVADGSAVAGAAAARVGACPVTSTGEVATGKGGAVAHGLAELLALPELEWFVIRDHDGDHFLCDTPRLVRLAAQMRSETGCDLILVNGGRSDPGRPMGRVRAEYEALINEVVWRGLHFALAREGRALDEAWCDPSRAIPDLQSGYKVYSRPAAERLVAATARADFALRRWGCEVLPTVEIVAAGGLFGELRRDALDEQPLTTYEGEASRVHIHGDMLCWTAARLKLPAAAVRVWFDAALARGQLRTMPGLAAAAEELRRYVLQRLGEPPAHPPRAPWCC